MENYQKICQNLLSELPPRTQDVISRRFGLKTGQKETLEAIGKDYGICRERIRQIETDGILKLKPKITNQQKIIEYFLDQFRREGNLKREDILLKNLGGSVFQNQIFFLLTITDPFIRYPENTDYYSFWTIDKNSITLAQKVIDSFYNILRKKKQLLSLENLSVQQVFGQELEKRPLNLLSLQALQSFLEISKKIKKGLENNFGLKDWPEINPRRIKDWIYLVLKKENKPLHFNEIARLINDYSRKFKLSVSALPQTVHNELIRNPKFVLVGRGLYALREWGYEPGVVKDIILKILKKEKKPLFKEELIKKVLSQRLVQENTILLNLSNKKYFKKTPDGKYTFGKT